MFEAKLNPKEDRRLLRGHRWAYRNEFAVLPPMPDGALVDVISDRGRFVGRGFYQEEGGIAVRLLTSDRKPIDTHFFASRISAAKRLRSRYFTGASVYRCIFGDSDGLPGLVVDRYASQIVAQTSCAFYDTVAETIAEVFLGDPEIEGVSFDIGGKIQAFGNVHSPVDCVIHDCKFRVDTEHGQKTGLFLDQRENWTLIQPFADGARVLDGHCYTGAWGIHAARYGAQSVLGIDTSRPAIERATEHAELNGVADRCTFERGDIQVALSAGESYDVVILDPPAFAKGRKSLAKALTRYQALNRDAMKCLTPGGFLITSSCSHPVTEPVFVEMLKRAAGAAQRPAQLLAMRGAGPDHPVLLSMPETAYLTCAVLRVV